MKRYLICTFLLRATAGIAFAFLLSSAWENAPGALLLNPSYCVPPPGPPARHGNLGARFGRGGEVIGRARSRDSYVAFGQAGRFRGVFQQSVALIPMPWESKRDKTRVGGLFPSSRITRRVRRGNGKPARAISPSSRRGFFSRHYVRPQAARE